MINSIDEDAPVVLRRHVRIEAPIERVWRLHLDLSGWTHWQSDIDTAHADGPPDPGTTFQWSSDGLSIASTVYALDAPNRILWGGPELGLTGIHEWTFTADGTTTVVRTAESWDGESVRADPENLQEALADSLASWLDDLRAAAEHPVPPSTNYGHVSGNGLAPRSRDNFTPHHR